MKSDPLSLVLLPSLQCNAACEYCFEDKSGGAISHENLETIIARILDYMAKHDISTLLIYWQGGEMMVLPPDWYRRAHDSIARLASKAGRTVRHYAQSNMIDYTPEWNPVLSEIFDNSIGSSMDFPNLHRKVAGGTPEQFIDEWARRVRQAQDAGIYVGVIAIPNRETLRLGAERFYTHFVDELQVPDFQINFPFPGGTDNAVKREYPLDAEPLSRFLDDLFAIWMERGYGRGVEVGPFDSLLKYFLDGNPALPCIWRENCANEFLCIDPQANVAQCDCWVASYPDFRFGNLLESDSLENLLASSRSRRDFEARPGILVQREDCIDCDFLAICHGGCPVRAYAFRGELHVKDPYCKVYKALFRRVQEVATQLAAARSRNADR